MDSLDQNEEKIELEEQFILRLPLPEADVIREVLHTKPEKLKKMLKLSLDPEKGIGTVNIKKKKLHAKLYKLPTILESYKTNISNDKSTIYKTADICHILQCSSDKIDASNNKFESNDGYAPPLKNVKKNRFRKTLINKETAEETEMITRELYYLLSTDMEAISTKFEILYDKKSDGNNIQQKCENDIFGGNLSLSSDSEIEVD